MGRLALHRVQGGLCFPERERGVLAERSCPRRPPQLPRHPIVTAAGVGPGVGLKRFMITS